MEILQEERGMFEITVVEKNEEQGDREAFSASSAKQQTTPNSPVLSSPASSPSHEFSFTVSMHSSGTTTPSTAASTASQSANTRTNQAPSAIDLTPADEIFFHGHLLPLHFLSDIHTSLPRSSTNSIDSFTLPVRDMLKENKASNNLAEEQDTEVNIRRFGTNRETHDENKSRPFSIFGLRRWRKPPPSETKEKSEKTTKKMKSDIVSQFVKRSLRMVKPLLSPNGGGGGRREEFGIRNQRESYSFSGSLSPIVQKREVKGLRGEFSAPASIRTSPTNSGRILTTAAGCPSPVSDSTMEELHAAIQAAITHCKKSISAEDKSPEFAASVAVK